MGPASDNNNLAVHIKIVYFLIVILIVGEIGSYYYSLYLFGSVQEDCVACLVHRQTGKVIAAEEQLPDYENDFVLPKYDAGSNDYEKGNGANLDSKEEIGNLANQFATSKVKGDNELLSADDSIGDYDDGDVSVDADYINKNENDNAHVDEDIIVFVEDVPDNRNTKRKARKRRVAHRREVLTEFSPDGLVRDDDNWVWLTSSSKIKTGDFQTLCRKTIEYCPASPAGPPGFPGIPGEKGAKGEQGDLGYPGDPGQPGPPGHLGLTGPKGPKGDPGTSGLDGLEGIPGAPGLDGVPGRDGVDGLPGINGIPGNPGIPGRPGTNATNGIPGEKGAPGPQGPQGTPGLPGARGKRGSDGKPGIPGDPGISAWMINGTKAENLLVPPVIIDKEMAKVITVDEGDNVRMSCAAAGKPTPEIVWRREDNNPMTTGSWETTLVSGNSLEFPVVNREHTGRYLCIASNGVPPMDIKTSTLEVKFKPFIKIPNNLVGAINGSFALLECHIEAFPLSLNDWLTEDGKRIENNMKYSISITEDSYKVYMTLNITYVGSRDFKKYVCISRNQLGETSGTVTVYPIDPTLPKPKAIGKETAYGQVPPKHVSLDDLCPTVPPCPTCPPPPKEKYCPDRGGASDVHLTNFWFGGNGTWKETTMRTTKCLLDQVGKPVYNRYTSSPYGTWLTDPYPPNQASSEKYWVTQHNDSNHLYEYANKTSYRKDNASKTYKLPFAFRGNSHVIYNGSFYYHMNGSDIMVRYELSSGYKEEKRVPNISFTGENYLYTTSYNYMDFAVDEIGIWLVYGLQDSNNTVILKFDPITLKPEVIWNISLNHRTVGDMFIICGVLYAVDSVNDWNAHIRFAFDLFQNKVLDVEIPFSNPFKMNTMIGYNPREKILYSWDRGHQLTYPIKVTSVAPAPSEGEINNETQ